MDLYLESIRFSYGEMQSRFGPRILFSVLRVGKDLLYSYGCCLKRREPRISVLAPAVYEVWRYIGRLGISVVY